IRDRNVTGVQTCALPISVDESREARLPAREVFIGTELDQASACTTRISRRAAGFDLERIRHRRTIREQPVTSAFVDEIDEHKVRSEERRVGKEWRSRGTV